MDGYWLVRRSLLRWLRLILVSALVALTLGGCGGGTNQVSAGDEATTTSAATSDSSIAGGDTTTAPATESTAATTDTEAPSGGGTAAGVCELVTADELAQIFNVPSVKTTVIPGPPDNCIVESDTGDPLTAWSLTSAQAGAVFDAFTSDPATIEVSGVGDKAAIVENTGLLVLKGDNLLVISISGGADLSGDDAIAASKQIGAFAAGRM